MMYKRAAIFFFCAVLGWGAQVTVTVLATTDTHGNIFPVDYYTGQEAQRGLAKISTLIQAVRRETPNTLLVDCGDTIQGTPLESLHQTAVRGGASAPDPMMQVMNALGYRAMVLGNHEFNYGLKNLERAREQARFPWLSANTLGGTKPFAPYIVATVGGVKLAFIGVTTPAIPGWEPPEHYQGYRFEDPVAAVERTLSKVRATERPDVVVVGAHMGLGESGENAAGAIAELAGIDALILGHTHQQMEGEQVGKTLVVQPKNWAMSLARIDFVLEPAGGGWKLVDKRSRLIPVTAAVAADPEILQIAAPYHEAAERYLNTPVAEAPVELDGRLGRVEDTALLDAVQAVQLHYAKADVSFCAMFNPRLKVEKGPVTVRQIAALYIYENELYAIEGTGAMVKAALENAARYYNSCPDAACSHGPLINSKVVGFNYDIAAGVEYEIDLRRPAGERVVNLRRNGKPLAAEERLRIAVNNYRAGGSGGYEMFRGAKVLWRSAQDIRSLIVDYYSAREALPGKADGNWSVVPAAARRELEEEAVKEAAGPQTR